MAKMVGAGAGAEIFDELGAEAYRLRNTLDNISETQQSHKTSVADPDPVGSGPFWSDPDPDVWERIWFRIRALINDSVSTFLVCVKAINT
jgi:hypothetical protein